MLAFASAYRARPSISAHGLKAPQLLIMVFFSMLVLSFTLRGVVASVASVFLTFDLGSSFRPAYQDPGTGLPLLGVDPVNPKRLEFPGEYHGLASTYFP